MRGLLLLSCLLLISFRGIADLRLPRIISSGMVMQQKLPIRIWGWADTGEKVTVSFLGSRAETAAGPDGRWSVLLPPMQAGGPFELFIQGKNLVVLDDVWVGEVWVCSGQSNMELDMRRLQYRYPDEIKAPPNPRIRQFLVPDQYDFIRQREDFADGAWKPAGPENILSFSAVAYFFAKEIQEKTGVAVGLINAALGGSPAEAWISEHTLRDFPVYHEELQRYKDTARVAQTERANADMQRIWFAELNAKDRGLAEGWQRTGPAFPDGKEREQPAYWVEDFPGRQPGAVWYQKQFEVPERMTNQPCLLELGRIVDADSVYLNGHFVGATGYQYPPRRYAVPAGFLRPGSNTLVLKVVATNDIGGMVPGKRYEIRSFDDTVSLSGKWLMRRSAVMPPMPAQTVVRWKPAGLFNAMIAPLIPFGIRGVIWYQGESNASRPADYAQLMEALVREWRSGWGIGDFPFFAVQLAGFMETNPEPMESQWAELRMQQDALRSLPRTGLAVTYDLGEWNDIHPENKKDVGHRLALLARKQVYGERKLTASGPLLQSVLRRGSRLELIFDETWGGLVTRDGKMPGHFALAGSDGVYRWAKTSIRGKRVRVWSDSVARPMSVRYAWADNPASANLYNREGLPAFPFLAFVRKP